MDERVALVTGGSKGIGLAIAYALAKRKIHLVLVARTEGDLAAAKAAIGEKHPNVAVRTVSADLTDLHAYRALYDIVHEAYGKLDILVNNAGDFKLLPAEGRESLEEIAADTRHIYAINAVAPSVLAHVMQPLLLASDHPQQLDVLSSAALEIFSGNNPYGPTKAAHERLSLGVVADTNGRVCTYRVYPSNVYTRLTASFEGPKLTPETVAEEAVRMMLYDEGTDLYLKMTEHGLAKVSFKLDYCKHMHENTKGDVSVDGLALVEEHRALIRGHFYPVIRQASDLS